MRSVALTGLVVGTIAFDLFVAWGVTFTVSWAGRVPPINAVGFWLFSVSPLVVTAYCVRKVRGFRRGEDTRA